MFNKIWKEQIVQPTSKVGIFKPKQGFDLEEDKDDDCNKQLQEYANKIKNTSLPLKEAYNSKEFEIYKPYFIEPNPLMDRVLLNRKKETIEYGYGQYISQSKTHKYTPIPENIACKALEMLEKYNLSSGDFFGRTAEEDIEDYAIRVVGSNVIDNTFLTLSIRYIPNPSPRLVNLELYKSENIGTHTLPKGPIEGRGFFTVAGYYLRTDWR